MTALPPYARLLGIAAEGDDLFLMPYGPHLIGSPGRLHGGAVAGLMELAANAVVRAEAGPDVVALKPVNVTVDYLREGALADTRARAIVLRIGRRIANVRVEAWQEAPGRLIAAARLNILLDRAGAL